MDYKSHYASLNVVKNYIHDSDGLEAVSQWIEDRTHGEKNNESDIPRLFTSSKVPEFDSGRTWYPHIYGNVTILPSNNDTLSISSTEEKTDNEAESGEACR